MKLNEVKNYFKTWYQLNKQIGVAQGTITKWRKQGFIDIKQQLRIEKFTKGQLKASLDDIPKLEYEPRPNNTSSQTPRSRKKD